MNQPLLAMHIAQSAQPYICNKVHRSCSNALGHSILHDRRLPVDKRSASCLEVVDWPSRTKMPEVELLGTTSL